MNIHEFVLYMKIYMDALYENISHHLIETTVTAGREILRYALVWLKVGIYLRRNFKLIRYAFYYYHPCALY